MPYIGQKPADIISTAVDTVTGAFSGNVTAGGTLGVTGNQTNSGNLTVSGAFTSPGIDDNADAVALEITSSEDVVIKHGTNNAKLVFNDQSNSSNFFIQQIGSSGSPALRFFESTGDERMRIHNGGVLSVNQGIALGVGSNNTASNVLDDYEEGTWTPTLTGASSGTRAMDSGVKAVYTKVGNLVTAHMVAGIGGLTGSASGGARLGGLPFNYNGSNNEIMGKVHVTDVDLPSGIIDCTLLSASSGTTNVCFFVNMFDNANHGELGLSAFDGDSTLRIVVTYHAV